MRFKYVKHQSLKCLSYLHPPLLVQYNSCVSLHRKAVMATESREDVMSFTCVG